MKRMDEYTPEQKEKIRALDDAMRGLVGILIPYNLIVQNFQPMQRWINKVLRGDPEDFGPEE